MHRVHHSIVRAETDSNFGFNLPWWDRLFGTYRREPAAGHDAMTIGLPVFRDGRELRLDRMLTQPFRNDRNTSGRALRQRLLLRWSVSGDVFHGSDLALTGACPFSRFIVSL